MHIAMSIKDEKISIQLKCTKNISTKHILMVKRFTLPAVELGIDVTKRLIAVIAENVGVDVIGVTAAFVALRSWAEFAVFAEFAEFAEFAALAVVAVLDALG